MNKKIVWINICALGALYISAWVFLAFSPADTSTNSQGVAVVELFTSEGCSSCPPADRLFGELLDEAKTQGKRVYGLAFHVDYWNYLGWEDPYSNADWSQRQRAYARSFGNGRVYTPQMVVNGTQEFVGSDYRKASAAIRNSLQKPETLRIDMNAMVKAEEIWVDYTVQGISKNTSLHIALVEGGIAKRIGRGENRGRTLKHTHVVRKLATVALTQSEGRVSLALPKDITLAKSSLISFAQHNDTREVLGATALDIER